MARVQAALDAAEIQTPDHDERSNGRILRFVPASEIDAEGDCVEWAVAQLILLREPTLVVGDGETFKTTLLEVLACHMAGGVDLFGRPEWSTVCGEVLFISGEDQGKIIRNRLEALCRGHELDVDHALRHIHILDVVGEDFSIDRKESQELVLDAIDVLQPVAVMFDPHADLTTAAENKNDELRGPIRFYRRCANAAEDGSAVLVAHHVGKPQEGRKKIDRIRGGSRLQQAARAVFYLERTDLGVSVEAIKFNRAERPAPFVLEHEIRAESGNRGQWQTARFRYVTQLVAGEHLADGFVLGQLTRHGRLNTSELKEIAKTAPGVSGADVSAALKRLSVIRKIDHEPGPRGAKRWGIPGTSDLAGQGGQGGNQTLPGKVGQRRQPDARGCLPSLEGSSGKVGCEQPDLEQLEEDEERESEWEELQREAGQ